MGRNRQTPASLQPTTLQAKSPSIFLEKSGRGLPLPDFSKKIEGDSVRKVSTNSINKKGN